jgi:ABC-2 type transport system ATP-binding protein
MIDYGLMIELKGLTKRFEDGVLALDHVTHTVESGEIFCLLGANGAGKTTTIKILLDFIPSTSGSAFINGHDCNKFLQEAKKYVSYVSENVQLYGMFTARQNLAFFAELAGKIGLKKKDYDNVMRTVGLPEKALDMRLKHFSKGVRQKLGIAITLLKAPPGYSDGRDNEWARSHKRSGVSGAIAALT